ncbi:hypothetical protein IT072_20860 (plasmid) [Leifsonia sp. ZF2019]|uniref:hypothetical protein n=1 Tax=Leifsonia sp. ZF2019 TaxID=2781978 RepID=UPI001CC06DEE|nr:hypothetical protein [Leifsonia sp. ZF2019]UAJ81712.1 hypothetical protein IT072_20860 [Leifsonia sp. ZF2019]
MPTAEPSWAHEAFASVSFEGNVSELVGTYDAYVRVFNPAVDPIAPPGMSTRSWAKVSTAAAAITADTQWADLHADPYLDEPVMGDLHPHVAAELARILVGYTTTPDECAFLLWTGYAETRTLSNAPLIQSGHRDSLALFTGPVTAGADARYGRRPTNWRPRDRAWAVGADIYARSAYIGGTNTAINEILATPHLEALPAHAQTVPATEDR